MLTLFNPKSFSFVIILNLIFQWHFCMFKLDLICKVVTILMVFLVSCQEIVEHKEAVLYLDARF
jgi:hypothetical protein